MVLILSRTRIGHSAYFGGEESNRVIFEESANFIGVVIAFQAVFEAAIFKKDDIFERADIGESAYFRERPYEHGLIPAARFGGVADFKGTKIGGQANFIGVVFQSEVRMTRARFDEARFEKAQFTSSDNKKNNEVLFNDSEFGTVEFGDGGKEKQFAFFAPERTLNFSGFIYHASKSPPHYMLKLLEKLDPYSRQPYTHLEKLYRDLGDVGLANQVYYERRKVEGNKIRFPHIVAWIWDRFLRYIFGYGVKPYFSALWVIALITVSTFLLARRGALITRGMNAEGGIPIDNASLSTIKRLHTGFWISINLLIPKVKLPVAKKWRVSDKEISVFRLALPITYHHFVTVERLIAWVIITVSLSLFSVTDLIRN